MQFLVIQRVLGLLILVFSLTLLPPIVVGIIFEEEDSLMPFIDGFFIVALIGIFLWFPVRHRKSELRLKDGFLIVVLFWLVLGLTGAIPFLLDKTVNLSVTDAVFESISGLTTTGATVITGLDALPRSILFYRQELQWLGGMGIIVLAVAILPMLGVGGMQLYRAETPGPIKDSKLTPRIKETAKLLWYIYLILTVACLLMYKFAGMSWFNAIGHAFSTVAIGGFSTHDSSIGFYDNSFIEAIAVVFMLLAGVNFGLHFTAWRTLRPSVYFMDSEFKTYIAILSGLIIVSIPYLYLSSDVDKLLSLNESIRQAIFQVVSIMTTTGFTTTNYSEWPGFLPVLLLFASFIGGCAGSTAGGMKVVRVLLLFKQGNREIYRLIHPRAKLSIKINRKPVPERVVQAVWGFFAVYIVLFVTFMLLVMMSGVDHTTAFSAVVATLNNLGPGLGEVAENFHTMNDFSKWLLCLAMLMGRLEIFTLLVILTPAFWRK